MSISTNMMVRDDAAWRPSAVVDLVADGSASKAERLPDAFTVNFGDAPVLSEFCLRADRAFAEAGVDLYLSRDLGLLKQINERNLDSWYRLLPVFDVAYGGVNPENSYFIYGVDRADGDIVATVAGHVYPMESLAQTVRSLEIFYPNPARQAAPGEKSYFTGEAASVAERIKGRVVLSGAGWFKPGKTRRKGFAKVLPRVSRAYARTTWGTDFTVSLVKQPHVDVGITKAYGYVNHAEAWHWQSPWAAATGQFADPVVLVWMPANELDADLMAWNLAATDRYDARDIASAAD